MKKYELTDKCIEYQGRTLYRIRALVDFRDVEKGRLGGYIEKESNLSNEDLCWVYHDAIVCGDARVRGKAMVRGGAVVCDNAVVHCNAVVRDDAIVSGNARVGGNARVSDYARVRDYAEVYDRAVVYGKAVVSDKAKVCMTSSVGGNVEIGGSAVIYLPSGLLMNQDVKIKSDRDYMIFKNNWSDGEYFMWTKPNDMWSVGCFYGTGEELIEMAYEDSEESGSMYKMYVDFVENMKKGVLSDDK